MYVCVHVCACARVCVCVRVIDYIHGYAYAKVYTNMHHSTCAYTYVYVLIGRRTYAGEEASRHV